MTIPFACTSVDLVTMVIGIGFPTPEIALAAAGARLATFSGAAAGARLATFSGATHDENWVWDREALNKLEYTTLSDLVTSLKQAAGIQ